MRKLRLTQEVTVEGKNFWGLPAKITFTPTEQNMPGWFWSYDPRQEPAPINAAIACHEKRRVTLHHHIERFTSSFIEMKRQRINRRLHTYEHIGALRIFAGLDGIALRVSGRPRALFQEWLGGWPPHFGRVADYWQAIGPYCRETNEEFHWVTINKTVVGKYNDSRAGYTAFNPSAEPCLDIVIFCDYPNLGRGELRCRIPPTSRGDETTIQQAVKTFTQGFPPSLRIPSAAAGFLGWPHHRRIVWPQEQNREETLRLFLLHRLADIVGVVSLFHHTALPALRVVSNSSGHEADIKALKQAQRYVVPLLGLTQRPGERIR